MKKLISLCCLIQLVLILGITQAYSQTTKLGIYGNVAEYDGDQTTTSNLFQFNDVRPGFGIAFQRSLGPSFAVETKFNRFETAYYAGDSSFWTKTFNLNLNLRYKLNNGY